MTPLDPASAAPLFSLLGNERRLRVLLALRDTPGGASPSVLSPILDIPPPQLSDLCNELLRAGLVLKGRGGRYVLFISNEDLLSKLAKLISE